MIRNFIGRLTGTHYSVITRGLCILCVSAGCYGLGIVTTKRQWPPYRQLQQVYRLVKPTTDISASDLTFPVIEETHLLERAFNDPLADGVQQLLPPCTTVEDIQSRLRELEINHHRYHTAYVDLQLNDARVSNGIYSVEYTLGRKRRAHAYCTMTSDANPEYAALIIPGTGLNQSTAIVAEDPDNYHSPIHQLTTQYCHTFVLVKPNEDFLAIHNGRNKLGPNFVYAGLLNRGSSYSANYLIHALAISKSLQQRYRHLVILGLSQGGTATTLISLQAEPDGALIASGYSLIQHRFLEANIEQIIIPSIDRLLTPFELKRQITLRATYFMFTFGRQETNCYGYEASHGTTANAFSDVDNIDVIAHENGHVFDRDLVQRFFHSVFNANQASRRTTGFASPEVTDALSSGRAAIPSHK